jgi:hypothetical protein
MDHTETIAYNSQEEIVKSLTVMAREPNEFTIEDFADATRSALDLIAALNNRIDSESRERAFANEDNDAEIEDLRKKYRAVRMELELERGRVKSLKATVVNQAEHITHLMALNVSAERDRAIGMAQDDIHLFDEDGYIEL